MKTARIESEEPKRDSYYHWLGKDSEQSLGGEITDKDWMYRTSLPHLVDTDKDCKTHGICPTWWAPNDTWDIVE